MSELLERKQRKARKDHRCDLCGGIIKKGDIYDWSKCVYDGTIFDWHEHNKCSEVCEAIFDYVDPDEGMTEDLFNDGCKDICRIFICPDCPRYDKEYGGCEDDETFCIDRMADFFQKYELYREGRNQYGAEIWKVRERKKK